MANELKAVAVTDNEYRVANYMILFGGRDVTGEYFTKETQIESHYTKSGVLYVDFEHGLDPDNIGISEHDVMGYIDWKTAVIDDTGVFVERVLNRRARYMNKIEQMIEGGLIGTSSQAVPGKTSREKDGHITSWPLMRDSITFTPAEPRMAGVNALMAAKSLHKELPHIKSLARIAMIEPEEGSCMKSAIESAESRKEFEEILRNAGFSRTDAKALVSRIKSIGHRHDAPDPAILAAIFQQFKL